MWLTMTTTGTSNVNFIFYATSSNTIMKICQIVLLNMENQNLGFSFDNTKIFFFVYSLDSELVQIAVLL